MKPKRKDFFFKWLCVRERERETDRMGMRCRSQTYSCKLRGIKHAHWFPADTHRGVWGRQSHRENRSPSKSIAALGPVLPQPILMMYSIWPEVCGCLHAAVSGYCSSCYCWLWNAAAAHSASLPLFSLHPLQSQFANGCSNLVIYCCQRCASSKMH